MDPQSYLKNVDKGVLMMGITAYGVMLGLGLVIFAIFGTLLPILVIVFLMCFYDMVINLVLRIIKGYRFDEENLEKDIGMVTENILLSRGFDVSADESRFILYLDNKPGRPPYVSEAICQGNIIKEFSENEKALLMLALSPYGSWPVYGNLFISYTVDKVSCQSAHDKIRGLRKLDDYFKSVQAHKLRKAFLPAQ